MLSNIILLIFIILFAVYFKKTLNNHFLLSCINNMNKKTNHISRKYFKKLQNKKTICLFQRQSSIIAILNPKAINELNGDFVLTVYEASEDLKIIKIV